jgi:tetratricopeptide (TPR) repeat protein/predicted Ser/Thr protein kinase
VTSELRAGDGERARRVQEIFDEASKLPEVARPTLLDGRCGGDVSLRAEVEALLRAGTVSTDELPPPGRPGEWTAAMERLAEEAAQTQLERGQTIGRFVVVGLVGRGGMGEVYAAYDPELDRKVAVKVVRPRMSSARDDHGRLLREAQAIAKLSHPNVVVVYDVGTIDERVFIAMEFVEGKTIGDWLREEKRSRSQILDVFLKAGAGLVAAHRAGLMHRDFKPDNVMIGTDGQVRVMDFGLARLVQSDEMPMPSPETIDETPSAPTPSSGAYLTASVTQTGVRLGSPAYMAPEQFLGKKTDARADQFSFCVALYEALYGERPFAGETALALQLRVLEGKLRPVPASSRVPSWLRRILLRGISISPDARFPSLDALLEALSNDPAKRARKWIFVGTTIALVLTAVGVTRTLASNERTMCSKGGAHFAGIWDVGPDASDRKGLIHRAFASSGRSYAETAFARVAHLLDQYVKRWTGMYTDACEATNVRGEQSQEVLDLRMSCLRDRLESFRALSDVFASADAKVVENAVPAAAALPSLDTCADIPSLRAVVKPPEDPATRKRVDDLRTELAQVTALLNSGQCPVALPRVDALIGKIRSVNYEPLLADVLYYTAGEAGNECGEPEQMLERLKEAHALASASHSDEVAAKAAALIPSYAINRLAQVQVAREWLIVARGAVSRVRRPTVADGMLAQAEGTLAVNDHQYGRALEAADRSIAVTQKLLGSDHPLTIAWELNKGLWEEAAGKLEDALKTDIAGRQQWERLLGVDHVRVALIWSNQGEVLNLLGRYHDAEAAYRRAVQILRQNDAPAAYLALVLTGLGTSLIGESEPTTAVAPLEEALEIGTKSHAPKAQLGETRFALARALWSRPDARRRALSLAQDARGDYASDKDAIAKVDTWLESVRSDAAEGERHLKKTRGSGTQN